MAITPTIVTLNEPVVHGKDTYTQLVFARTMRGKDMVAMDAVQGVMRKNYAVYASMAGVPLQVLMEMESDDLNEVALAVAPLMGKPSSPKADEAEENQETAK